MLATRSERVARRNARDVARLQKIGELTRQIRDGVGIRFGTNFITDDTGFSNQPKTDLNPIGSNDPLKYIQASDYNEIIQALLDIQTLMRAAQSPYSGSGGDGARHFDGSTTILGVAPATVDGVANTYHFARDLHLDSGTIIDAGVHIWCENVRFHCRGTCTINGVVHNNGRPATARGGAGASQTNTFQSSNGSGGSGSNGTGSGGAGTASGTAYEGWTAESTTAAQAAGAGSGQGGGGGDGDVSNVGGGGGAIVLNTGPTRLDIVSIYTGRYGASFGNTSYTMGSGGGGGGANAGTSSAQGGGAGAGGCQGFFGIDDIAGSGVISCDGGAGFHAVATGDGAGGGGGGGGGGLCAVVYFTNGGVTVRANGGAGTGGGANGSAGTVVKVNLRGDGT